MAVTPRLWHKGQSEAIQSLSLAGVGEPCVLFLYPILPSPRCTLIPEGLHIHSVGTLKFVCLETCTPGTNLLPSAKLDLLCMGSVPIRVPEGTRI